MSTIDEFSIEIMKLLGELNLKKLIDKLKKNSLRKFLFEKDLITQHGMARSSKAEIINKLVDHGLLKEAAFNNIQGHYTWYKELARIISKDNIYPFTAEFARNIMSKGKSFGQKSIDVLIDYLLFLEDQNIEQSERINILNKIDIYCRKKKLFNFKSFMDQPIWVLFSEVRRVISKQEGKFLTFGQLGEKIYGYRIYHKEILKDNYGFMRIQDIVDYISKNLQDTNVIAYIKGIAEAIAIYKADSGQTNTQGFFKYLSKKPSLKDVEIILINKIRMKLSVLNRWKDEIPTLSELERYFNIKLHSITSESEERQFTRVFSADQIILIKKNLMKDLAPLDSAGCKEIIDDLYNYNPIKRVREIQNKYSDYNTWQSEKFKSIYGDSSTSHPKIWNKRDFQDILRGILFQRQGGFIIKENKKRIYHIFDGITGEIITWKELTLNPHLDPITNDIILIATDENDIEVGVIHHIDFNKENNILQNYLWISRKNHMTNVRGESKTKFIAQGMMASLAFDYGFAPRFWSYEAQVKFNDTIKREKGDFPAGDTIIIKDDDLNLITLDHFLGKI